MPSSGQSLMAWLPNLPGFRPNSTEAKRRPQLVKFVDRRPVVSDSNSPLSVQSMIENGEATGLLMSSLPLPKSRPWVTTGLESDVLSFRAYYRESVCESALENCRTRKCEIRYFLEDDTIEVREPLEDNSGLLQGLLLRRQVIPKAAGEAFTAADLAVGATVKFYGKVFYIYDANSVTRTYLRKFLGKGSSEPFQVPEDQYYAPRARMNPERIDLYKLHKSMGSTEEYTKHRIKKDELREIAEAYLGKPPSNTMRRLFDAETGQTVLRFFCQWDDRARMFGETHELKLHYYLCDDTIDIQPIRKGSIRPAFSLGRGKAKGPKDTPILWNDLKVGTSLTVHGRPIFIYDADAATRGYYKAQGTPQPRPVQPRGPELPVVRRIDPPPSSFGSEEDSLRSCQETLLPIVHPKRMGQDKTLRYKAVLKSRSSFDAKRVFVIQFFVEDNTVAIREVPERNSGFVGGAFLKRSRLNDTEGKPIEQSSFFIGANLQLGGHQFLLIDADKATLRHMESNSKLFPHSDVDKVWEALRLRLRPSAKTGELLCSLEGTQSVDDERCIAYEDFKNVMCKLGCSASALPEQAILTAFRAACGKRQQKLQIDTFVQSVECEAKTS